jgi:hypothetical protein
VAQLASAQTARGALVHVSSVRDSEDPNVLSGNLEDDPMVTDAELPVATE